MADLELVVINTAVDKSPGIAMDWPEEEHIEIQKVEEQSCIQKMQLLGQNCLVADTLQGYFGSAAAVTDDSHLRNGPRVEMACAMEFVERA